MFNRKKLVKKQQNNKTSLVNYPLNASDFKTLNIQKKETLYVPRGKRFAEGKCIVSYMGFPSTSLGKECPVPIHYDLSKSTQIMCLISLSTGLIECSTMVKHWMDFCLSNHRAYMLWKSTYSSSNKEIFDYMDIWLKCEAALHIVMDYMVQTQLNTPPPSFYVTGLDRWCPDNSSLTSHRTRLHTAFIAR